MRIFGLGLLAVAVLTGLGSVSSANSADGPCGTTEYTLWAGQDINVGTVTIENDDASLYVKYELNQDAIDEGCTFGTLHLWAGTDLELLPVNGKGIPVPGHFPYQADSVEDSFYEFEIPLADLSVTDACIEEGLLLYVVAHAEVWCDSDGDGEYEENETAFAGDQEGDGPRWWHYMEYTLACCEGGDGELETAFAEGGWVFSADVGNPEDLPSLDLNTNRWGWAINLTAAGETTYEIWAGAGQNDTSKGTHVGTLTLNWTGTTLTVTYDVFTGYTMSELHIYAGDSEPTTAAPGQYGWTEDFDPFATSYNTTFNGISDTDGDGIWVIAHAVVFIPAP